MPIFSSKDVVSDMATAFVFVTIYYHPLRDLIFVRVQTGELSGEKMEISTSAAFISSRVALISVTCPRIWICFLFSILAGGRAGVGTSFKNFYLVFCTVMDRFYFTGQGSCGRVIPQPTLSIPIIHLEMTSRWVHGPYGLSVNQNLVNGPFITLFPLTSL